jgi:subtilisin family serine protease
MHTMGSHSVSRNRFLRPLFLAFSLGLACAALSALNFAADAAAPQVKTRSTAPSSECATPDNGVPEPLAFPALERSKRLAALGVDQWHNHAQSGKGIKFAILDSGFRGYKDYLGKALPKRVTVHSFREDGDLEARDSQHGILCGEVLHTLAPDAELLLANWDPERPDQFLAAVRWAKKEGARVLSCSLIMPSWSDGEGNGPVHKELSRLLGNGDDAGDLLFFASAGNTAQRHWGGVYHAAADGLHEWAPGRTWNTLTPWSDERISVELCWSGETDYEVVVREASSETEVSRSTTCHAGDDGCAVARFTPSTGKRYQVSVKLLHGKPSAFHLVVLGGYLGCARAQGSIPFPADGPEVVAVGAVDTNGQRVDYSSCGPNSKQPKPDLVAAVPFPSLCRARPFSGTSAAAPQAAGLAGLIWSAHPDWPAKKVRETLLHAAHDLGPVGHDDETGYGLIRLPDEQ